MEFSSNPGKLSYLTKQLDINPLVRSMSSVPLNLAMICNLCRSCDDPLPNTMPELYDKLAWNIAQLKLNSTEKYGRVLKLSSYQDLPNKLQQSWLCFCQLAYSQIETCPATFSWKEASNVYPSNSELETFGLLKPAYNEREEEMFSFLHPCFRYYLAVLHLLTRPQSVQLEVLEKMGPVSPMFWRFLLSMSESVNYDLISAAIQAFQKLHHSFNDVYLLSFESKKEIVDQEVVKSAKD